MVNKEVPLNTSDLGSMNDSIFSEEERSKE